MSRETLIDQFAKLGRFLMVGLLAAIVDIGGMVVLIKLGLDPLLARAISLPAAMLAAYQMNRAYTFGASGRSRTEELLRYMSVTAVAAASNYGIFAGLLEFHPPIWPALAAAIGLGISMWVSFFGYQFFAFRSRREA
ncbi:MAG: GtrA family protein [Pseudomonadota bacterium]